VYVYALIRSNGVYIQFGYIKKDNNFRTYRRP